MGLYVNGNKIAPSFYISNNKLSEVLNRTVESISETDLLGTTVIGNGSFWGCENLKSINLPDTISNIGDKAFDDCISLTSIAIPRSVKSIGEECFTSCTSMQTIDLSDSESLEIIKKDAFKLNGEANVLISDINNFCDIDFETSTANPSYNGHNIWYKDAIGTDITEIYLDTVVNVGSYVFYNDPKITKVVFSDSVETIGDYAFYYCHLLSDVQFGNNIKTIGNSAFSSSDTISSINIPNSVEEIGDYAFSACTSVTSITLGNSIKTIGEGAFQSIRNVSDLVIPDSVETIGSSAFKINGSGNLKAFENLKISKNSNLKNLGSSCFSQCIFQTIYIPTGVTAIPSDCFFNSRLTSIELHEGITSIGSGAFEACHYLIEMTLKSVMPPALRNSDAISTYTETIYIPTGSLQAYQTATNWSNFADKFVEIDM